MPRRGLLLPIAFLGGQCVARDAAAGAAVASQNAACPVGEGSALAELACELRRGMPAGTGPVTVVVSSLAGGKPGGRLPELATRLARVVAGALGPEATPVTGITGAGAARVGTSRDRAVLSLGLELADGELRVAADLYGKSPGFWDRIRAPSPGPVAHVYASRRVDGEIASFFPTIQLVVSAIERATLGSTDTVALACGDVDRDGSLDLAVVGRQKIQVGRIRRGHFSREREVSWSALSGVAPSPLREPIGAALVHGAGGLRVGVTDRERAFDLRPDLSPLRGLDDAVPWALGGCVGVNGSALSTAGPCARGEPPAIDVSDVAEADAVAGARWVTPLGVASSAVAFRSPRDGSVTLRDSSGHTAVVPDVGAALALGDLDRDGVPELLSSVNTLDPRADALVVGTWSGAAVRERLRVPVPGGISAVAVCPPDGDGPSKVVVATETELLVIR